MGILLDIKQIRKQNTSNVIVLKHNKKQNETRILLLNETEKRIVQKKKHSGERLRAKPTNFVASYMKISVGKKNGKNERRRNLQNR